VITAAARCGRTRALRADSRAAREAGYAFRKPFSAVVGSLVVGFQAPMP
jgi:hypothetical protein